MPHVTTVRRRARRQERSNAHARAHTPPSEDARTCARARACTRAHTGAGTQARAQEGRIAEAGSEAGGSEGYKPPPVLEPVSPAEIVCHSRPELYMRHWHVRAVIVRVEAAWRQGDIARNAILRS
jgi:hypothetical protein